MNARLNKRERRAQRLLEHYATCERLARALGVTDPDGKRISTALFKIEREAHRIATAYCNGERASYRFADISGKFDPNVEEGVESWENVATRIRLAVGRALGANPAGLFVNADARGYALKIDPDKGKDLIDACRLQTDWGGYGLLSPEITGD